MLIPRRHLAAAFGGLVVSELLLVHWLRLAFVQPPLTTGKWLAVAGVVFVANAVLLAWLRKRTRWGTPARQLIISASISALAGGLGLFGIFALAGLLRVMGVGPEATRTLELSGGAIAVVLGCGTVLWGYLIGQRHLVVEQVDLPMPDLPTSIRGLRVAQITDLHIGPQLRARQLSHFVRRVNALDPDLLAITGDIFDFDPAYIAEGCRELAKLRARYGVYAVLGNHDVYTGADQVSAGLREIAGIHVLRDAWDHIEINGDRLYVVGIDDPGKEQRRGHLQSAALEKLARSVPEDAPRLLLMHRPNYFKHVAELGFSAALAGHTHGGQVTLPPPAHHHNISRLVTQWTRGRYQLGRSTLYVSRGMGVGGVPMRLNCPREISMLTLTDLECG